MDTNKSMFDRVVIIYCNRSDTAYLLQSFAYKYALAFGSEGYDEGYSDGLEEALTTFGECDAIRAIKTGVDDAYSDDDTLEDIDIGYSISRDCNFLKLNFI